MGIEKLVRLELGEDGKLHNKSNNQVVEEPVFLSMDFVSAKTLESYFHDATIPEGANAILLGANRVDMSSGMQELHGYSTIYGKAMYVPAAYFKINTDSLPTNEAD
jgi:hypothetical protein